MSDLITREAEPARLQGIAEAAVRACSDQTEAADWVVALAALARCQTKDIRDLRQRLSQAVDALQELHDRQNGPPLLRYQEQWERAMNLAEAVLDAERGEI